MRAGRIALYERRQVSRVCELEYLAIGGADAPQRAPGRQRTSPRDYRTSRADRAVQTSSGPVGSANSNISSTPSVSSIHRCPWASNDIPRGAVIRAGQIALYKRRQVVCRVCELEYLATVGVGDPECHLSHPVPALL